MVLFMKNIPIKGDINYENEDKEIKDTELFSLKITDSLYKKDIGKFLEILSSQFIWSNIFIQNLQTKTLCEIKVLLTDNTNYKFKII